MNVTLFDLPTESAEWTGPVAEFLTENAYPDADANAAFRAEVMGALTRDGVWYCDNGAGGRWVLRVSP